MANFILNDWTQIYASCQWTPRRLMRCVSVGDYIYMSGGNLDVGGTRTAEIWRYSIDDGWEFVTDDPGWPARAGHGFVYHNNKFWIFGGSTAVGFLNDIWSSDDCVTWTYEGVAAWSTRHEFAYCLHKGEIYLSGGFRDTGHLKDVFKTSNMINWVAKGNLGLVVREHVMLSFIGNLYCFYGDPNGTSKRYVYRSINDGTSWVYMGEPAYSNRREHLGLIDSDGSRMAIIGGYDTGIPGSLNDVRESTDLNGVVFSNIAQINPFTERSDFAFVHHIHRCYIFGGTPDTGATYLNDMWSSPVEPFADFSGTPRTVYLGDTVDFTNLSEGDPGHGQAILMTMWNFGYLSSFGNTYALMPGVEGVSHRFLAVGVFTISITVVLQDSTLMYETKVGYITVLQKSLDFSGAPRSGPVALKVKFESGLQP